MPRSRRPRRSRARLLVLALPLLPALFRPLLSPLLGDAAALNAARLAIAFGLLVVPAAALGASLPLLAGPLEKLSGNYGLALGRLYGINTLGALAGTLAAELCSSPRSACAAAAWPAPRAIWPRRCWLGGSLR